MVLAHTDSINERILFLKLHQLKPILNVPQFSTTINCLSFNISHEVIAQERDK